MSFLAALAALGLPWSLFWHIDCVGFKDFQPSIPNRNLGWKKMGMSGDDERGEAVLSLHMRGLLGHPAGVRPSNHSRSIGNRPGSIISLTSHGPSFPPCVGAAGIFQGEPSSARCQDLFPTFIGFANERQFPHGCVEPGGARSVCGASSQI